ncbi:MAG: hypothetical protein NT094_00980, partial [Candidatus Staskawiczbacteria bacterium]|nr:hypothetical protein [Candidatus Staskawiczbacteria bacterium]
NFYIKETIDGEAYDPFSAQTLKVLPPSHKSFREEIVEMSRKKYAVSAEAAQKLMQAEESKIMRSSHEKSIIEGKGKGPSEPARNASHSDAGGDKPEEPLI